MIYSNVKYNFEKMNTFVDKPPEWMNSFFEAKKKPEKQIDASKLYNANRETHYCSSCGKMLNSNEVAKCSSCLAVQK